MASAEAVRFDRVSVRRGGLSILDEASAVVPEGSCTVIVGPNGAGKTTLLLALLGEVPYRGRIVVEQGGAQGTGTRRVAYVPQRIALDRGLPLTVIEFLALGQQTRPLWLGVQRDVRRRAAELLELVHAAHLAGHRLGALSGGETQRVLLALALQRDPELLILDEPSAGVDFEGEHLFCELLDELRARRGFTQLMVSHDLGMVAHHATHVICLKRRVVAEGEPSAVLTDSTLNALFGLHMGLIHGAGCPPSCCAPSRRPAVCPGPHTDPHGEACRD